MTGERVLVLGAGIQGVCAALALRRHGYRVTIMDQASDCMLQASLRNTGKLHLGFVYVKDATFKTPYLMLDAALSFDRLIQEWTGHSIPWPALKSRPFTYMVLRDSLLTPGEILSAYERLERRYQERLADGGASYLGDRPSELWHEAGLPSRRNSEVNGDLVLGSVRTCEVSIDLAAFRTWMRAELVRADVETLYGHAVGAIERTGQGFRVEGSTLDGTVWRRDAGLVVNCLWAGRLSLDRQLGFHPGRNWVYRLKYRLFADLPEALSHLPSMTFVQGPFGDVVIYPAGLPGSNVHRGRIYISWYPVCMRGWCSEISTPTSWQDACNGKVDESSASDIAREALDAFDKVVPGLKECNVDHVDAGVICSWGETDIDDPESELHKRYEAGVHAHDGYFSIDTGKLTCAPYFAQHLIEELGART